MALVDGTPISEPMRVSIRNTFLHVDRVDSDVFPEKVGRARTLPARVADHEEDVSSTRESTRGGDSPRSQAGSAADADEAEEEEDLAHHLRADRHVKTFDPFESAPLDLAEGSPDQGSAQPLQHAPVVGFAQTQEQGTSVSPELVAAPQPSVLLVPAVSLPAVAQLAWAAPTLLCAQAWLPPQSLPPSPSQCSQPQPQLFSARCTEQEQPRQEPRTQQQPAKPQQQAPEAAQKRGQRAATSEGQRTTVMLRNMPNHYDRDLLMKLLDAEGFARQYDFIYMPMDFKTRAALGYAFLNMVTPEQAQRVRRHFDGFSRWCVPSGKRCCVGWSDSHQGLEANVERYRNSPLFHPSVPDTWRPLVLAGGVRVPFPAHTKKIKPPRQGTQLLLL